MNAIVTKGDLKGHKVEIVAYEGRKVRVRLLREGKRRARSGWSGYTETIYLSNGSEVYVMNTSIKEIDEEERLEKELRKIENQLKCVRTFKLLKSKGRPSHREQKEILEKIEI